MDPNTQFSNSELPPPPPTSNPMPKPEAPTASPPPPLPPTPVYTKPNISTPPPTTPPSDGPPIKVISAAGPKPNIFKSIFKLLLIISIIGGLTYAGFYLYQNLQKEQVVTLEYWSLWEPKETIDPLIQEFEKQNPNIKIDYKMQSLREYRERLDQSLKQNRGPDVFRFHNTWLPMFSYALSPIPQDVMSTQTYESTFYPQASETLKANNQYYGLPLNLDGIALFTNDDLFSQAGLEVPTDWDSLRETAIALTKCENPDGSTSCSNSSGGGGTIKVSGVALGTFTNVDHWQDVLAVLLLQNNVPLPDISSDAAKDVIEYISNFAKLYRVWDPTGRPSTEAFASGQVAMYFGPSWRGHDIKNLNKNLKFTINPLPQLPLDPTRNERPVAYASFWAEGVNKNSKNSKEAWKFLQFISQKESQQSLFVAQSNLPQRGFGSPPSRQDLFDQYKSHQDIKTFISQAPLYKSWYLASSTQDGPKGLNSRLAEVFAKLLEGKENVTNGSQQIKTILSEFGIR